MRSKSDCRTICLLLEGSAFDAVLVVVVLEGGAGQDTGEAIDVPKELERIRERSDSKLGPILISILILSINYSSTLRQHDTH